MARKPTSFRLTATPEQLAALDAVGTSHADFTVWARQYKSDLRKARLLGVPYSELAAVTGRPQFTLRAELDDPA